jgi:hypothetical protein
MTAEELARIAAQGQAAKPAANALFAEINKVRSPAPAPVFVLRQISA